MKTPYTLYESCKCGHAGLEHPLFACMKCQCEEFVPEGVASSNRPADAD